MRNKQILIILTFLSAITVTSFGQKLINSPYSRFNIGTLEPAGSFRSQAMGGLSTSLRGNNSIYFFNPASYSSLDTNSFIFDFGFDYSQNHISHNGSNYKSDDMNFDHLFMAFPLKKGGGFALGVIPISNGYYKIIETVTSSDPNYDPIVGEFKALHSGEGTLTNLFAGAGFNITRDLSVGINMTILFGTLKRSNQVEFGDADYYFVYSVNAAEKLHIGGTNLDLGMQYNLPLKNNYFLTTGVSLTTKKHYKSTYELDSYKFTAFSTRDTISYVSETGRNAFIPGTLRVGVSFGKKNKFTTGLEYVTAKWSNAEIPGSAGYAADTRSYSFGAEYIPDKFSNYSFFKKVEYRIGAHMGDNYLIFNGEQMKEIGASFGVGIPMSRSLTDKKSMSRTNLFFDYNRRSGSGSNSTLPVENYFTVGVSLNLYDFWFVKRKYD
jgi:hypothetical protein